VSIDLPDALEQRRQFSDDRLSAFISELSGRGARQLTGTSACVYATGLGALPSIQVPLLGDNSRNAIISRVGNYI
jgi:hypothetical protein